MKTEVDLLAGIETGQIDVVYLQFIDVPGIIKTVTIPATRLGAALREGVWLDACTVDDSLSLGENDLYLRPDFSTVAALPWDSHALRFVCDLALPDGAVFPADPRHALKSVLAESADLGFDYSVASELEFFIFSRKSSQVRDFDRPDSSGYFDAPSGSAAELCNLVAEAVSVMGFDIKTTHHEVAGGQYEIDIAEMPALKAADAIVTVKWALRAYAGRMGLAVSFMPKPIEGVPGSGLHMAQLLKDRSGRNLFSDPSGRYQLSDIGQHFIAGQLAHARGMCAVVAPLVNSYKRLLGGAEAPSRIYWARISREPFIRVPDVAVKAGARVELRAPDPSCNPYLTMAAMLKSGLDGVTNRTALPEPVEDGVSNECADRLPETLAEALEELDWDPVVRAALGQAIFERFLAFKREEWAAYRRHISLWEIQRYAEGQ